MADIIEISDLSFPELDVYARLTQTQMRSRQGPETGIFIAESTKVIEYALNAGYEPISMLTARRHLEGSAKGIISRCGDIPVYTAGEEVLEQLTGYRLTRGVLCAMRRKKLPELNEVCAGANRLAVLEGVADPTNLGAIFRSAAALGMDAVLIAPGCGDLLSRRAVRVSMGTVFQVPWTQFDGSSGVWQSMGVKKLKELGFKTVALALTDRSVSIEDPSLCAEKKLAIVLGSEGEGLFQSTVAACDYTAKIPMFHGVDSLNVAAAAAVAFWQLRTC